MNFLHLLFESKKSNFFEINQCVLAYLVSESSRDIFQKDKQLPAIALSI